MTGEVAGRIRWQSVPPASLAWAGWDDDHAIYHRESGQTHFLNASAAALLREILVEPIGAAEAAQRLAAGQHGGADERFFEEVRALILRLEELGLVVRVTN